MVVDYTVILVVTVGYFLPSVAAMARNHSSSAGIVALNFLLGWTLFGWAAALIWSLWPGKGVKAVKAVKGVKGVKGGAKDSRGTKETSVRGP